MEEIKIYISIKRLLLVFLEVAAFLAILFGLRYYLACQDDTIIGTIFNMLGIMVMFLVYFIYLSRKTKLIISDVQLRVEAPKPWIVKLSGVESFYVDKFNGRTFIGINYKEDTWEGHKENIAIDRKQRSKAAMQGCPYEVYVGGLSKTPQEICNILNSRINK